jgi:hypothetical protein
MASKVRKQIYIEPEQETLLKRLSSEAGVPEAELIRQAIDQHLQARRHPRRDLQAWEAERAFIAELIAKGPVPGGRTWKREDLYER